MPKTVKIVGIAAVLGLGLVLTQPAAAGTAPTAPPTPDAKAAPGGTTEAPIPAAGGIVIYNPLFQSRASSDRPDDWLISFAIPGPGATCFGSCDCNSCTCDSSCSLEDCQNGCNECFDGVDPGGCPELE